MICSQCKYDEEKGNEKFVGIFSAQHTFSTTNDEICGIYGCPKCKTIQFTTDFEYIKKRKTEYKKHKKSI